MLDGKLNEHHRKGERKAIAHAGIYHAYAKRPSGKPGAEGVASAFRCIVLGMLSSFPAYRANITLTLPWSRLAYFTISVSSIIP